MKYGRRKPAILKYKMLIANQIKKHKAFKNKSVNFTLFRYYWTGEITLNDKTYRVHWQNYIHKMGVDYISICYKDNIGKELTKTQLVELEHLLIESK